MEHLQLINKYNLEYKQRLHVIPQKDIEEKFKKAFGFYDNYDELNKFDLALQDFMKIVWIVRDRYESVIGNKITWSISVEDFDKFLQPLLEPMRNDNILFYSMELQGFRKGQLIDMHLFEIGTKFPTDIVDELEINEAKKICRDEENERKSEEYDEEHEMSCSKCGCPSYNVAPNGAGELEECKFHCLCGWEEE